MPGLLEALCRTGNFRDMVDYACREAHRQGEDDKANLFRIVADQVANAYRARPVEIR